MVKPGGTGRPRLAISARLAPLPPRRSRRPALPSALPSPKVIDPLAGFYRLGGRLADGGLLGSLAALATGLAGPSSAPCGPAARRGLGPGGTDGFDFAAVFLRLDFATALAMAYNNPKRGEKIARLTPL